MLGDWNLRPPAVAFPEITESDVGLKMVPRIQSLLLAFLALLAFHPNTHVYVSAYSDNAGPLCSLSASAISEMARSRHGGQSSGGGFSVSAVDNGDGTYSVGVAGGSFRGLLLIARDEADNLVGGFSNVPSGLSIKSDCGGSAAVEHNVGQ